MEQREPRKKVVVLENDGIYRIVGTFDPSVHTMREVVEYQTWRGGKLIDVVASLWKVQPRMIMYRQTIAQQTMGKLGEFHPQQK